MATMDTAQPRSPAATASEVLFTAGRDGGEGTAEEETRTAEASFDGAGEERSAVSLLDLPDELLSHIYEHLLPPMPLEDDWRSGEDFYVPSLMPLSSILVNRRIFRVAQPIQHRTLVLLFYKLKDPQAPLTHLCGQPSVTRNLVCLDLLMFRVPADLSFLLACSSLRTLRISAKITIPASLTDTLKQLTQLEHLQLCTERSIAVDEREWSRRPPSEWDDLTFSIERDMPQLKHFTIAGVWGFTKPLLDRGVSGIPCITFCGRSPGQSILPWSSIRHLTLREDQGYFRDGWELIAQLKAALAVEDGVALEQLSILGANLSLSRQTEPGAVYYEELIPDLLELLQPHPLLKRISFRNYYSVKWWESETQLPSVEALVMEEQPKWHHKDNHKSIAPFLAMFPSLRTLHLSCAGFLPSSTREAILAASPLDPSLPHPASFVRGGRKPKTRWDGRKLKVLVDRVQKSEVLEFRYKVQADAPVELRFMREAAGETFVAEWWWL